MKPPLPPGFAFAALPFFALLVLSSCATPKTIEGHKVTGTRWVDGRVVYIVDGDQAALRRAADEAAAAARSTVFQPAAQTAPRSADPAAPAHSAAQSGPPSP